MADSDVMLALRDGVDVYTFGVSTAAYSSMRRSTRWRWSAQARTGRSPAVQFVGRGEDSITLEGVIYPQFKGGLNQLPRMRAEADKGRPFLMADSLGRVDYGYWCITQIDDAQEYLYKDGTPRKTTFQLSLTAYGEDRYDD